MGVNRDELLTKLAMELAEWPTAHGHIKPCGDGEWRGYNNLAFPDSDGISEREYLQRRAELINKPSWDEAPEWAQWLAQDGSGIWYWYEYEPLPGDQRWGECDGNYDWASKGEAPAGHVCRQTLERRPAESKESDVIYAINTRTKEHIRVPHSTIIPPSSDHKLVHADADGWIPWDGKDKSGPLPGGYLCQWRSEELASASNEVRAGDVAWHGFYNISAYRPIRSEEDRAVEAMLEVVHGNGHLSETGARALYRAGYRKQEVE